MYLKEQYEKLQLENKRKDFVGLMKTVSDNLMETVPARKKIKDIKF